MLPEGSVFKTEVTGLYYMTDPKPVNNLFSFLLSRSNRFFNSFSVLSDLRFRAVNVNHSLSTFPSIIFFE